MATTRHRGGPACISPGCTGSAASFARILFPVHEGHYFNIGHVIIFVYIILLSISPCECAMIKVSTPLYPNMEAISTVSAGVNFTRPGQSACPQPSEPISGAKQLCKNYILIWRFYFVSFTKMVLCPEIHFSDVKKKKNS